MTHTKTIKRPDGVEWRIEVVYGYGAYVYEIYRKDDDFSDWILETDPRLIDLTPAEIQAAKLELWEKMKPML